MCAECALSRTVVAVYSFGLTSKLLSQKYGTSRVASRPTVRQQHRVHTQSPYHYPTSSYSYTHNYNGTTVSTIDIATANLKFKTKVFASVANQLFWRRATVAPKFSRTGRSEPQISVKGDVAAGGAQSEKSGKLDRSGRREKHRHSEASFASLRGGQSSNFIRPRSGCPFSPYLKPR
ncbi:hypothetical protein V9T40_004776 [Parthenolecanium corni]|uniref:Uncharacterized protein n=1 Tax=Parthenolecanium corni TaxID=536013 RepID=A0AAN9TCL8_9HEMI